MITPIALGRRLRRARHHAGLTQQEAAALTRVSRFRLSAWEQGHRRAPLSMVLRLADLYGCPVRSLTDPRAPLPGTTLPVRPRVGMSRTITLHELHTSAHIRELVQRLTEADVVLSR
jgi:transcriptional regulator with XRE-family HTH domain